MDRQKATRKYAIITLAVYIVLYYGLLLLFPDQSVIISDLLSPFGIFCSICIIGWNLKWQLKKAKKVWLFFIFGNVFFLLGDLTWFYFEILLKQNVPFPSVCDVFYLINTFLFFVAVIIHINVTSIYNSLRAIFDIIITMLVASTLSWKYIMIPIYQDLSQTTIAKLLSLAYPISDLGFLCGILTLYFIQRDTKDNSKATQIIIATFLLFLISDTIYSLENTLGIYAAGNLIDPVWPLGIWLLAIASLWTTGLGKNYWRKVMPEICL